MRNIATLFLFAIVLSTGAFAGESVTVSLENGKSEKGELLKSDPDKIVLSVKVAGNNVDLPIQWSKIKEVSNGLTRDKAIAEWKKANEGKLCDSCSGDRVLKCPKCEGTGKLPVPMADCKKCNATGSAPCTAKGCEKGSVECPGKCLKLSQGKWELGEENLRWQTFRGSKGFKMWSERHLGEVIEIVDGLPVNKGKCPTCGGTAKAKCGECKGTGEAACAVCKGNKQVPTVPRQPVCADCKGAGATPCATCKGKGLKP